MIRKTISMPNEMAEWMEKHIAGSFSSDSEYIRHLIRKEQQESKEEIAHIRKLLIEGEESGLATETISTMMARVKKEMIKNGELPAN